MAKPDPHELMTAALILRGKIVNVNQLNTDPIKNSTTLVKDLVENYASKVVGGSGSDGFLTVCNFVILVLSLISLFVWFRG